MSGNLGRDCDGRLLGGVAGWVRRDIVGQAAELPDVDRDVGTRLENRNEGSCD